MYDDISKVSYKKMRAQVTGGDEYKGPQGPSGLKQYPIGDRKYSARYFVEGTGGVFHVYYRPRMSFKGIAASAEAGNEICRIHPDNSLEFVSFRWISQQQYLGAMLNANVQQSSKHGGVILRKYDAVLHPVFKGLRVDIGETTHAALTPYTVQYRRLIQTAAKEEFKKYAQSLQLAPVLMEAMTVEGIMGMYAEHQDATAVPVVADNGHTYYETLRGALMGRVLEAIEARHYVDAVCLYALHTGTNFGIYRRPFSDMNMAYVTKDGILRAVREILANSFKNDVLRNTPEVFKYTPKKEGEALKTSKWGYDIRTVQVDAFTGTAVVR